MQQMAHWLDRLGMSEYAPRFAENHIDFSVLRHLTDQDLKDLGVVLGDRIKILRAIREFSTSPRVPAGPQPAGQHAAERRQLTVMFSDLVGSTALSARLDPEDLREVISAYQRCVADTVVSVGGFVAKYLGDGVLVYFGYPQAHEDDAERAVRSGLELVAAVADLRAPVPLQTRVGIATGLVVVGDLIGLGAAQEQSAVGETPNLAARLQTIAEPNTVVIAEGTRKLLGNIFELEDLGPKELKGIAARVRAWAVLRWSGVESRFEALHSAGFTKLIGREEECELLLRRWAKAKGGEGRVVLISGEAGIGKSRLTAALLERITGEPHNRLRYFCSSQHTDSAFYPIIRQIVRAAGFAPDDATHEKLDKLDATLAMSSTPIKEIALVADMLSLPNDGRYPAVPETAQQRRQATLEAFTTQIDTLAREKPLLIILEDAQWADPTTLELFDRAIDRIARRRVLFVVTARPEFQPSWIANPPVTALVLSRLAQHDAGMMVAQIIGDRLVPTSLRENIVEKCDGVPLFIEEMTNAVLEAVDETGAWRMATEVVSPALTVPATLQASLMARLDRLGSAKEVAQIGAAIGREFFEAVLAAVMRKPAAELHTALERLISSGLLFRQGLPPHASYLFKHALVQDAAYGTLLRERRRALHARIAETLEIDFPEVGEHQPELLARHYTDAGLIEKAAVLWGKAGQRSLGRSALVEAAEQLKRAVTQMEGLTPKPGLRRERINLQVTLINPLMHLKGWAAPETKSVQQRATVLIEEAEAVGEGPDDPLLLLSLLYSLWSASWAEFDGKALRALAARVLARADQQGTIAARMIGHRLMGVSLVCTGALEEGRAHLDRALELYDPTQHRALMTRFGQDAQVAILAYRSLALWLLGYPDAAGADGDMALRLAREIGQAATLMSALFNRSLTHILCGAYPAASALIDELLALAREKSALQWEAPGLMVQGYLFSVTGRALNAVDKLTAGLAAWQSTGATASLPTYWSHLAVAYSSLGQLDAARHWIAEAMVAVERTGEVWGEAQVARVAGEIELKSPVPDLAKAEAYFERSLAIARMQRAKSFELSGAIAMARLLRDQGKPAAARDLLGSVYSGFTEGFNTLDLKQAKVLLRGLE